MKCPTCKSKHAVRLGMTCGTCQYSFVFNPKQWETHGMTDGKFLAIIRKTSRNGTYYYSRDQLFVVHRTDPLNSRLAYAITAFFLTILVIALSFVHWILAVIFGLLALSAAYAIWRPVTWRTPREKWDRWIDLWLGAGKPMEGLVETPQQTEIASNPAPAADWPEDDLYDYGALRVLVVSNERLVDLLVMNHLHSNQHCVIVSHSGYPAHLQPQVRRMLEERDDLPVFLLHDATVPTVDLSRNLDQCDWLPLRQHPVIDLGFTVDDYSKISLFRRLKRAERAALPADSLPPAMLLAALASGFANGKPFSEELDKRETQLFWSSDGGGADGDFG